MKRIRGRDGTERLWVEADEVENLMSDELAAAGLLPSVTSPVVNIEAFIEAHLKVAFDQYATLDPDVLGEVEFRVGQKAKISINRDLTGSAFDADDAAPGLVGRWRATAAHEAAHVILHSRLFDLNPERQRSLFEDLEPAEKVVVHLQRCLKRDVYWGRGGDWREVQANMGMAALLMPRGVFLAAFTAELAGAGRTRINRNSTEAGAVTARLASQFQVSRQAALIRLESLELLANPEQPDLLG